MKSFLPVLIILLYVTVNTVPVSAQSYAEDAAEINPVLTGTTIPDATIKTVDGQTVQLKNLVSKQPTVLIFYRGSWCPYCNKHLAELQQVEKKLVETGYQIMAVSPDRPGKLKESIQTHDLDYTLLSDSPMELSKAFGLAYKVDEGTVKRYKENGMDLEKNSGYDHHLLPVPAVFLINPDGLITFQYVNPDYKTRVNGNVLLTAAKAYYPKEGTK
jgi:peroxiredoxin